MLVVSFYTPDYAEHADRLRESCERFNVRHRIDAIEPAGSWVETCALKADFILVNLQNTEATLWLDADAEILRPIAGLADLDCDLAVYHDRNSDEKLKIRSGTVLFNPTAAAISVLQDWGDRCAADPESWDQAHLYRALEASSASVHDLDISYCAISNDHYKGFSDKVDNPHIVHYQASREVKRRAKARR